MERINENDLLKLALEVFRKNLPVQVEFNEMEPTYAIGRHADFLLRMAKKPAFMLKSRLTSRKPTSC
jgi:hypothetical protein